MSLSFTWNIRTCIYISCNHYSLLIILYWTQIYVLSLQFSSMVWRRRFNVRKNLWQTSVCPENLSQKNNGRIVWCSFLINYSITCILLHRLKIRWSLRYKAAIFRLLRSRNNLWIFSSSGRPGGELFKEMHQHEG